MSTTLLLIQASEPGTPNVAFSGSGTLVGATTEVTASVALGGAGTLVGTSTFMSASGTATLTGSGTVGMSTEIILIPNEIRIEILDTELDRAPTIVTVSVFDALPDTNVTFQINGSPVLTQETNSLGSISAAPLPVDGTHLAETHTVTCLQAGSLSGSADFELLFDPIDSDTAPPTDDPPVSVGTDHRWVLQDLLPGGLGDYVLEKNPDTWVAPAFERALTTRHTTAPDGQFHVIEGQEPVTEWTFSGFCPTEAMYDQLVAYWNLNRRFYVIDHRERAWLTTFTSVDLEPRTRRVIDGVLSDWGHDYTVTAVAYSQTPGTPA